ncbi:MAG: hypothetical protein H7332_14205 [Bdellovibrionales bacterium]|nr:hypothetical protein [Ramlibacter sp.]
MKKMKLIIAPAFLSIVAAAALVACGGGGGDAPAATVGADVATSSSATAASIGATVIVGASADEEVYNVAADIGDSWQVVLNNKTNTYVVKVITSQFGLTTTAPVAFTKSTTDTFTTVTGTNLSVQIDSRTKTIGGKVTVGGKAATISGSGYQVADIGKLAGTYFFAGVARNVSGGGNPGSAAGSFIVSSNGTDITACDSGIVVNGACANVAGGSGARTIPLTVSKDSAGIFRIKQGANNFGILNVSAGDRGPVLIIDRFGPSEDPSPVLRTGIFFAAKSAKLSGNEFDGNWTCSSRGANTIVIDVSGSNYSVTDSASTRKGTLLYNKVTNDSNQAVDLDGAIIAQGNAEPLSMSALVLPLSSSLVVVLEAQEGVMDVCRKNK